MAGLAGPSSALLDSCPSDLWPRLGRLLSSSLGKASQVLATTLSAKICCAHYLVWKVHCNLARQLVALIDCLIAGCGGGLAGVRCATAGLGSPAQAIGGFRQGTHRVGCTGGCQHRPPTNERALHRGALLPLDASQALCQQLCAPPSGHSSPISAHT